MAEWPHGKPEKKPPRKDQESSITCPRCGFVYDIRYLSEHCPREGEEGYHCLNCKAILEI
ncbi:MAG: hypothetical protein HZA23_00740 [Nitrospirae bacterium]|nr:hypothetical protein [Nitrospirota bacterium]